MHRGVPRGIDARSRVREVREGGARSPSPEGSWRDTMIRGGGKMGGAGDGGHKKVRQLQCLGQDQICLCWLGKGFDVAFALSCASARNRSEQSKVVSSMATTFRHCCGSLGWGHGEPSTYEPLGASRTPWGTFSSLLSPRGWFSAQARRQAMAER